MAENQVWRLCSEEPQGDFIVLSNISDPAHCCPGTQIFLQLFLLPWRTFCAYFPITGHDASDRYDLGGLQWTSCRGGLKRAHLCLASTLGFPRHKGVSIDFISVPAGFSHPGLVCLPRHSFGHGHDETLGSVTSAPSLLFFSKDWEFWDWEFQYAVDNLHLWPWRTEVPETCHFEDYSFRILLWTFLTNKVNNEMILPTTTIATKPL